MAEGLIFGAERGAACKMTRCGLQVCLICRRRLWFGEVEMNKCKDLSWGEEATFQLWLLILKCSLSCVFCALKMVELSMAGGCSHQSKVPVLCIRWAELKTTWDMKSGVWIAAGGKQIWCPKLNILLGLGFSSCSCLAGAFPGLSRVLVLFSCASKCFSFWHLFYAILYHP